MKPKQRHKKRAPSYITLVGFKKRNIYYTSRPFHFLYGDNLYLPETTLDISACMKRTEDSFITETAIRSAAQFYWRNKKIMLHLLLLHRVLLSASRWARIPCTIYRKLRWKKSELYLQNTPSVHSSESNDRSRKCRDGVFESICSWQIPQYNKGALMIGDFRKLRQRQRSELRPSAWRPFSME